MKFFSRDNYYLLVKFIWETISFFIPFDQAFYLQAQTQELAFSNYKTFIQTSTCSKEIFSQFGNTEAHLQQLDHQLSGLVASVADPVFFRESGSMFLMTKRENFTYEIFMSIFRINKFKYFYTQAFLRDF